MLSDKTKLMLSAYVDGALSAPDAEIAQLQKENFERVLSVELFPELYDSEINRLLEMRKLRMLLESILLSLGGGLLGWVVGHGLIAVLSPWIAAQTGVSIGFLQFVGYEAVIIPALIALASVVGYLPAMAAYRTDVAKALSATP